MNSTFKDKLVLGGIMLVAALLALAIWSGVSGVVNRVEGPNGIGAAGNLLIENYIPVIRQNGGLATALPISGTGGWTLSGGGTETGGVTFGTSGTTLNRLNFGSCAVVGYANTISASTTATVDCGSTGQVGGTLTGVSSGDLFDAYSTTTISCTTQGCLSIVGSTASTTNGYGTLKLYNGTGGTFTWTGAASTSIVYQVMH